MYTGEVLVSTSNIESLLSAADILLMDDLKQVCFRVMDDSLNIENASMFWRLANKYKQPCLALKCRRDFLKLNSVSSLMNAPENIMQVILGDDNLEVKSEVEVCEMLLKWLQVQTDASNEVHPDQLLPLIRWSGINVDYFQAKLLQDPLLMSDPTSISFLSKVSNYLISGVQFRSLQTFHRASTGLDNCLITIGLNDGEVTSPQVCCISLQRTDCVRTLEMMPTNINSDAAACVVSNTLYITGIRGKPYKETWKWTAKAGWVRCADMLTGRRYHCISTVASTFYVLGGLDIAKKKTLSSVEGYNIATNTWSRSGQLIHAVKLAACITYKNYVYVFGGRNKENKVICHVQVYNPAQQTCTLMTTDMPCAYIQMRSVLFDTCVILLDSANCFIYNFETETWVERKQFRTEGDYFAMTLDHSTVYIAGGGTSKRDKDSKVLWSSTDEVKSVSVLDIIDDKPAVWKYHAKLPKPGMIDSYVYISLPTN